MPASTTLRSPLGQQLFEELKDLPSSRRFSSEQLEVIYSLAYGHVMQKQYAQALPIFMLLTQYGPTYHHYWSGLGLCLQALQRHGEAIYIYSLMLIMFPDNLEPALRMAESEFAMGDVESAQHRLQTLLIATQDQPELQARVSGLLQRFSLARKSVT